MKRSDKAKKLVEVIDAADQLVDAVMKGRKKLGEALRELREVEEKEEKER